MMQLQRTSRFNRALKKLLKKQPDLTDQVKTALAVLQTNPRARSLSSHKVIADDKREAFSSRVTGDLRIIWRYADSDKEIIELINIGGHSGSNKVYR